MIKINDTELELLSNYILKNYGINLKEKSHIIEGRLTPVLLEKGYQNFGDYLNDLFSNETKDDIAMLVNRMTTNFSYFMREKEHFSILSERILPSILPTLRNKDLRIWSAGCATGEESYTLAMILEDHLHEERQLWDKTLLATDISLEALEIAKQGIYTAESIKAVPDYWKLNYFHAIGEDRYQINEKIRNEVIFRAFNLMEPLFPFKRKFHVIFCRNVLIYFDNKAKQDVIRKFENWLEPGGYLFLGHSESINRNDFKLEYIRPAVYRKGLE